MATERKVLSMIQGSAILALLALPLWPFMVIYMAFKLISGGTFNWQKELRCAAPYAAAFWVLLAISFLTVLVSGG